jgi:hypothetical protein
MKHLLTGLALWLLLAGVWMHDWRMILASASTATIWPLITADVDDTAGPLVWLTSDVELAESA